MKESFCVFSSEAASYTHLPRRYISRVVLLEDILIIIMHRAVLVYMWAHIEIEILSLSLFKCRVW